MEAENLPAARTPTTHTAAPDAVGTENDASLERVNRYEVAELERLE